jgi:rhamnogalacturonyl hydrolase YesR
MRILFIVSFICFSLAIQANEKQTISTKAVADSVLKKGLEVTDIKGYQGSLLLQGMSELALASSSQTNLNQIVDLFDKIGTREIKAGGSFISYQAGGNGAALLNLRGVAPSLTKQVSDAAKRMVKEQNRSSEGILVPNWISKEKDQIFIDMAFAVTPYLLYAGLIEKNEQYIDLSIFETEEIFRVLKDSQTGLLHQGRGFVTKGVTSEDNWSRGNGWCALALSSLVRDLPKKHPKRKEIEHITKEFFLNVLKYQDANGVWHQEMTDPSSFVEISGTGLFLYALGIVIEEGLLEKKYKSNFIKGLEGMMAYIAPDGSVSNTCFSNLCPGMGTKKDYVNHVWHHNEPHAFGSVLLALAQALKMNVADITLSKSMGNMIATNSEIQPARTYVRFAPERSGDVAWENDRIAFRVYSQQVKSKVGSGVDVWAKSVDYSIIDNWYRLNARGLDYHVDRGEGYDFYHMGFLRGCGGTAIWHKGKLYPSSTYSGHRIIKNHKDEIVFELNYEPFEVAGKMVREKKTIRMLMGTNFYQVESLFETENGEDLTVAIGLTMLGNAKVANQKESGCLAVSDLVSKKDGMLGSAIFTDPNQIENFTAVGNDQLMLVNVKSNTPFVYYVGAAWSGNPRFTIFTNWDEMINSLSWGKLNEFYSRK